MMGFIQDGGFMMWPLMAIALVLVAMAVRVALRLPQVGESDPVLETRIDAMLFWGGWALLLGVLGTLGGIYQAAGAISQAGEVSAPLVWGGIKVALTTTLVGLTTFTLAALVWFGFRSWYRKAAAA